MAENQDDFNPKKAFEDLSANINQPDKFAQIFCEAAKKQKSIDATLKKIVKELITNDKDTVELIKNYQRQVDKEDSKAFIRKVGTTAWLTITFVVGAIVQALIRKYF